MHIIAAAIGSRLSSIICLLITFFSVMPTDVSAKDTLTIGIHPYLPEHNLIKRFTPLASYLSDHLKIPVKIIISKSYAAHIENIGNNVVDIAYMGPASYVELTKKYGKHPLLARLEIKGNPNFNGYIITNQNSGITVLSDLKGKRFAFGSPQSTMSYLVPRHMLKEAGVSLESLAEYKFLGNHRNVALSVMLGEFDAGAVKEEVYFSFKKRGLKKVAISPAISEHLFICRKGITSRKHNAIHDALLNLSKSESGMGILRSMKNGVTGLVPVSDTDYDNLRKILHP